MGNSPTSRAIGAYPSGSVRNSRSSDVVLESGGVLRNAWLTYQTFGTLAPDGRNAIVIPTHFGGTHQTSSYFVGAGRALDPAKYFIVIFNLIGNGISVSPSNIQGIPSAEFPAVTVTDNVLLQRQVLELELGVRQVQAVVGFSMGAVQAYHWAVHCADLVSRFAAICGSARTSEHNRAFLTGMAATLMADSAWQDGHYVAQPLRGLRAMALAWCAWPPSAHFYRERLYECLGYHSLEDFLERYWVATYTNMDANNLLCQIRTWRNADVSQSGRFSGDLHAALGAITARGLIMPSSNDSYFPAEDSALEVEQMSNAELRVIASSWGHWAGSGRNRADLDFIDQHLSELLRRRAA